MPTDPSPDAPWPGFISPEQAAARYGYSYRTAINRSDLGISIKLGRRRWLYERGLDALEENDTGAWADAKCHVASLR
jgi:hypothetical protein